jgi:hypothetical protein
MVLERVRSRLWSRVVLGGDGGKDRKVGLRHVDLNQTRTRYWQDEVGMLMDRKKGGRDAARRGREAGKLCSRERQREDVNVWRCFDNNANRSIPRL